MIPLQGKGMPEAGRGPGRCGVTLTTVMRKTKRSVIRGPLIIRVMAVVAVGGQTGEGASGVTLGTVQAAMPTGEGKAAVIKGSRHPGAGTVAVFAGMCVVLGRVVRGRFIVGAMTGKTVCRQASKGATGMTISACQTGVTTGQGKGRMLKGGRSPSPDAMAVFTVV